MDLVTDAWIRKCIGIAIVFAGAGMFALALAPLLHVIRWW